MREIAQRVGVFRHDAVVLRAFDRARHVEREEFDQRPESELREMQIRAGQRFELHGRRAERDAILFPEPPAPSRGQRRDACRSLQTRHRRLQVAQRRLVAGVGAAVHVAGDGVARQRQAPRPAGLGGHRARHRRQHPAGTAHARKSCDRRATTPTSLRVRPRRDGASAAIPRRCNRGTDPPAT